MNGLFQAKERIAEIEQLNDDIAEQNDGLKEGTAEGIQNL